VALNAPQRQSENDVLERVSGKASLKTDILLVLNPHSKSNPLKKS
jgi:hypothetical protein